MNYIKHKMRGKNPAVIAGMVLLGIIGIGALIILFGFVIMWLWNALMPDIFGLPTISYWQGIGLFILAKILCGVGGGGGSKHKKSHRKHRSCSKQDRKNDLTKWELYDKFWEEEGDAAYQDFKNRKNGDQTNGDDSEKVQ